MMNFHGYIMPSQYGSQTVTDSVRWTRNKCSIFDVSHMGSIHFKDNLKMLSKLTPTDVISQPEMSASLCLLTNHNGGIIDDTVFIKMSDDAHTIIANGANVTRTLEHIKKHIDTDSIKLEHTERALIAVQGPKSQEVLERLLPGIYLDEFYFGSVYQIGNLVINRGGYTGEDGFEISIPSSENPSIIWEELTKMTDLVRPAGLLARDILRQEAGLCLYGQDIDDTITPREAGLGWTVKNPGDYLGKDKVSNCSKFRKGFLVKGNRIVRPGADIYTQYGRLLGKITSGTLSPTVKNQSSSENADGTPIAVGYVSEQLELGETVKLAKTTGVVTKLPFVTPKYKRKPSPQN